MSNRRIPPVPFHLTALSRRSTLAMLASYAVLTAFDPGVGGSGSPTPSPTPTPTPTPTPSTGPAWFGYGHDAQHTAQSAATSQDLGHISWSSAVDLAPQYATTGELLTHYG